MNHLKVRLFALILILVCAVMIYYNWRQLHQEHIYSLRLAAFGPVGVVGGFFLLLFPGRTGKPTSTKEKILVLLVFALGFLVVLINLYLMDPSMFGK
jgi:NhaP-type Na+/H+ or K+/H+ antiporter